MEIIEYIKNQETVIDFFVCETLNRDTLHIFALIKYQQQTDVNDFSNTIIQFKLNDINSYEKLTIQLQNDYRSIFWLTNNLLNTNTIDLLIIPYLTKTVDTFEFDMLTSKIIFKESLNLPNLNEYFNVSIVANNTTILIWDNNGLISGWDKIHMKPLFNVSAHNKFTLGVEQVVCDPFTRYINTNANTIVNYMLNN